MKQNAIKIKRTKVELAVGLILYATIKPKMLVYDQQSYIHTKFIFCSAGKGERRTYWCTDHLRNYKHNSYF